MTVVAAPAAELRGADPQRSRAARQASQGGRGPAAVGAKRSCRMHCRMRRRRLPGSSCWSWGTVSPRPFAGQILGDLGAEVDQGREAGRRRRAQLGAAVRGRRVGHLPVAQPQQALGGRATCVNASRLAPVARLHRRPRRRRAAEPASGPGRGARPRRGEPCANASPPSSTATSAPSARDGPLAQRPGYDPLMQAFGGIMSVVGEPGRPPVRVGPSIVDMGAGMWARDRHPVRADARVATRATARVVDVSLFETAASWMTMLCGAVPGLRRAARQERLGPGRHRAVPGLPDGRRRPRRRGRQRRAVRAALRRSLGEPQWADDPRFVDNPQRVGHAAALYAHARAELRGATTTPTGSRGWTRPACRARRCRTWPQMLEHPQTAGARPAAAGAGQLHPADRPADPLRRPAARSRAAPRRRSAPG